MFKNKISYLYVVCIISFVIIIISIILGKPHIKTITEYTDEGKITTTFLNGRVLEESILYNDGTGASTLYHLIPGNKELIVGLIQIIFICILIFSVTIIFIYHWKKIRKSRTKTA